MKRRALLAIVSLGCLFTHAWAAQNELRQMEWEVDGVRREAAVFAPASATAAATPILFLFHGRGGHMDDFEEKMPCDKLWPGAICVYPQGLTGSRDGRMEGKKTGWQHLADDQGGRDLRFFDVMLEALKKEYKIDDTRIYVSGFSNGADFTYLLWASRGDQISAVAPCAGAGEKFLEKLTSIPAMIICGEKDPHYKIDSQKRIIAALKEKNGCDSGGERWSDLCTFFPSKVGKPVASYIHPLGHKVPPEAAPMIVRFFQQLPV